MSSKASIDYEAVVIGAGVCGIYQIKKLIDLGYSATVLEAEGDFRWDLVYESISRCAF